MRTVEYETDTTRTVAGDEVAVTLIRIDIDEQIGDDGTHQRLTRTTAVKTWRYNASESA